MHEDITFLKLKLYGNNIKQYYTRHLLVKMCYFKINFNQSFRLKLLQCCKEGSFYSTIEPK